MARRAAPGCAAARPVDDRVNLEICIRTNGSNKRLAGLPGLAEFVSRYCLVDSFVTAALPDYNATWERMDESA